MGRHGVLGAAVVCLVAGAAWLWPGIAGGQAIRPTTQPTSGPTEWKIPLGQFDFLSELSVSADGRLVCLTGMGTGPSGSPGPGPRGGEGFCWVLDTATGKRIDVMKLVTDKFKIKAKTMGLALLSPDGRYVALSVGPGGPSFKSLRCVVDLKSRAVRKLYEGPGGPSAWCGRHLYVSAIDAKMQVGALRRVDPATGKSQALKVHGVLAGADPKGTYLVCGCLPDALDKPAAMPQLAGKGTIALVTPTGKVLRKVMPFSELSRMPVISPGGKYLALGREKSEDPRRPPKLLGFRVTSADGKASRDVPGNLDPAGVTDAGDVIARVIPVGPKVKASMKWFGADGKQRTLVDNAKAGVVCGKRLFYVTTGKQPMLKCNPLK